jgi:purine-binding chemotaxis protein CheW
MATQAAPSVMSLAMSLLFRSERRLCALPLDPVRETMRPLPTEPVAGVPPFVLGVALVRGEVTPVVHVGRLLDPASRTPPGRFVHLELGPARTVCLAVDEVLGVRDLGPVAAGAATGAERSGHDLPPLLGEAGPHLAALATLDSELLWLLSAARVVPDSIWPARR